MSLEYEKHNKNGQIPTFSQNKTILQLTIVILETTCHDEASVTVQILNHNITHVSCTIKLGMHQCNSFASDTDTDTWMLSTNA